MIKKNIRLNNILLEQRAAHIKQLKILLAYYVVVAFLQ